MTHLIDADALKSLTIWVTDDEGIDRPVVKLTDIDAAPTVCCAECVNYAPYHEARGECTCGHMEAEHTFGCVDFERRQP